MIFKTGHKRGLLAEAFSRLYLRLKGYTILEQRYRNIYGEIDLIVRKGHCLVAVEIKFRQSSQRAAESILPRQRQRITRALQMYLAHLHWVPEEVRFDVILLSPDSFPQHLENAWQNND